MTTGRTNQKTRTRVALLDAAARLLSQGRPPSVPDAAAEALVSPATAYRYFASADALWSEAAYHTGAFGEAWMASVDEQVAAAGDDVSARAEVAIRVVMGRMLAEPAAFRQAARASLDQWFAQQDTPPEGRVPVRAGRRTRHIRTVVAPLREQGNEAAAVKIERALATLIGTEALIALTDVANLNAEEAMATLLDAARWLISGALTEHTADQHRDRSNRKPRP